jgi:hypothetical protein
LMKSTHSPKSCGYLLVLLGHNLATETSSLPQVTVWGYMICRRMKRTRGLILKRHKPSVCGTKQSSLTIQLALLTGTESILPRLLWQVLTALWRYLISIKSHLRRKSSHMIKPYLMWASHQMIRCLHHVVRMDQFEFSISTTCANLK